MQPGLEFGSRVLQAWQRGRELREEIDRTKRIEAEAIARREQEQKQHQDRIKLAQEDNKRQEAALKQQGDIANKQIAMEELRLKQQKAQAAMDQSLAKAGLMQRAQQFRAEYGGGPTTEVPTDLGVILQVPQDEKLFQGIEGMEDMILPGRNLPLVPFRQQEMNLAQGKLRLDAAQHEAEMKRRAEERAADLEIAKMRFNAQMKRYDDMEKNAQTRADALTVRHIRETVGQLNRSKTLGKYANGLYAYESVKDMPVINPGISDVDLLYKYLHTIDDSVVRPNEVETVMANANTILQNLGIKLEGIGQLRHFLKPKARAAILAQMKRNVEARGVVADAELNSAYELLKESPLFDKTFDELKSMTMAGAYSQVLAEDKWKPVAGKAPKDKANPFPGHTLIR